jgi:hypothetical protein
MKLLHITSAVACGPRCLRLVFDDGTRKCVDVSPLLCGPVFLPLRRPAAFARVKLDRLTGTVTWPNGADLAPEALKALPALPSEVRAAPRRRPAARRRAVRRRR